MSDALFVILGNQLFSRDHWDTIGGTRVFMAEDLGLCTYVRHHKQKIAFFLAAMRSHRDALIAAGHDVDYVELGGEAGDYEAKLARRLAGIRSLHSWEVEDAFFEARLDAFADAHGLERVVHRSPMFLTPRETFADFVARTGSKKDGSAKPLRMATFYAEQRRRLGVLIEGEKPLGGQWSFDAANRERIPKDLAVVETAFATPTDHVRAMMKVVNERFADHPGTLDDAHWWLPTTRSQALAWLDAFVEERLDEFGPYEDALTRRGGPFLWHSALSPLLNVGLLTPQEALDAAIEAFDGRSAPRINSVEGFVRQIIGWREFVRGVYRHHGAHQLEANFFEHTRTLAPCWWEGMTGLPPLDDAIARAQRYGYAHHIERLMVLGNLMLLCEVLPAEGYRWFMEMFVDSSDWVMAPNVFGMALFSDGGVFATKPYISGSNYIFKMSDYAKPKKKDAHAPWLGEGQSWADAWDGLYWRFIANNLDFFRSQPRLSRVVGNLDRMSGERKTRIFDAAERFLDFATE
ncbi:MAG: cryptochrome/photolyase family protein [Myxococcota bacterium]